MRAEVIDALVLKAVALTSLVTTVSASTVSFFAGGRIPFLDATFYTVGMAIAGSLLAFAYGTPIRPRKKLYGYAVGGVFIGVWATNILPHALGWVRDAETLTGWYVASTMDPPFAGALALASRWLVPFVVDAIPAILRRVFNITPKAGPDTDYDPNFQDPPDYRTRRRHPPTYEQRDGEPQRRPTRNTEGEGE